VGLEPTPPCEDRILNPALVSRKIKAGKVVAKTDPQTLSRHLTRKPRNWPEIYSDLARVCEAWPALPEPIQNAILALIGTAQT